MQLFEPIVCDDDYERLDDELKWIAHLFGDARDLDVFQEGAFVPAAEDAALPGAKDLADYMEGKRSAAHDAVNEAVESERLRLLLLDIVGWIEDGSWRNASTKWQDPLQTFARTELKKRRKKLVKQAAALADLNSQGRHQIRIKAKKLRYMVDFFKAAPEIAVEPKAMKRLSSCLGDLQTQLGEMHDEEAKVDFLEAEVRNLPREASHMTAFAAGVLAGTPRNVSGQLAAALDAYSTLARTRPF